MCGYCFQHLVNRRVTRELSFPLIQPLPDRSPLLRSGQLVNAMFYGEIIREFKKFKLATSSGVHKTQAFTSRL